MDRPSFKEFDQSFAQFAREQGFRRTELTDLPTGALVAYVRDAEGAGVERSVYISAGIHGDEPAGPLALSELMRKGSFSRNVNWTLLPLLNPDGWQTGTRENAQGIDLNRDFFSFAASETQAVAQWIPQRAPFDLYLSLHEDWESSGFYLYEINACAAASLSATILQAVAGIIPIEPQGIVDGHKLCAPGLILHPPRPDEPDCWPEAIFHADLYSLHSYTFESPSSLPLAQRIAAQVTAVKAAVQGFG
ncbi:MAG: M14 family metallocarboxypeptidase [Opitutales bacterium]|nr:M14 family metallocarboxypeptidase [Opitutales bacterium]